MTELTMIDAPEAKPSSLKRFLPLIAIVAGLGAFFALDGPSYISMNALRENRDLLGAFVQDNYLLAVIGFIALYAVLVAISFPGASLLTIVGGLLFGTIFGTAWVVIGATLGATGLFLAARTAFGDTLRAKAGDGLVKKFEAGFRENELSYMFILRLVPLFPFFVVNIAPALFGVKLRNFVLATLFGIIPGTFVYASVGNGIGAVFDRGEEANLSGLLLQPSTLLPIVGLVVLALIPVIYKKFKKA